MHEGLWYSNPDWWVAIFTGALFAVTAGLWIFTALLWWSTRETIRLARAEFVATHRPKLVTRNFQTLSDRFSKDELAVVFKAQNIGDSLAKIIEVRSGSIILSRGKQLPGDLSFAFKEAFNVDLKSGERELFPANGLTQPTDAEWFEIYSDAKDIYCVGIVVYLDQDGTKRETGFCRRYLDGENRWEAVDSEYEYSY